MSALEQGRTSKLSPTTSEAALSVTPAGIKAWPCLAFVEGDELQQAVGPVFKMLIEDPGMVAVWPGDVQVHASIHLTPSCNSTAVRMQIDFTPMRIVHMPLEQAGNSA